ncbi:MAG: glycosyltransferase [Flavobacteriaceae bacterium]|nr:glycosyltransferase [Flavobacteriaceae bacterium]
MSSLSITIITPNLNGGRFLEACIVSIQNQQYPNLKHVVIDGGSTDNSIEILKTTCTTYEVVKGLNNYEAIDYGFKKYPSEIQAWLNSDDLYRDGAINTVMNAFEKFPDISWLTGTPSISNDLGVIRIWDAHIFPSISKYTWTLSSNIFIQQESTFWRKKLYEEVGGISKDYRYANDYDLWSKFFKKELLYSIPQILASFRMHSPAQLSVSNRRNYVSEVKRIQSNYDIGILRKLILKLLMGIDYVLIRIPILRSAYDSLQFRQKFLGFTMRLRFDDSNQLLKC